MMKINIANRIYDSNSKDKIKIELEKMLDLTTDLMIISTNADKRKLQRIFHTIDIDMNSLVINEDFFIDPNNRYISYYSYKNIKDLNVLRLELESLLDKKRYSEFICLPTKIIGNILIRFFIFKRDFFLYY